MGKACNTSVTEPCPKRNVTLSDIAHATGLSRGGVSYALRGHPSIPRRTVDRVRRVAAELGYRQDLRIGSLMSAIRKGRLSTRREPLAFLWLGTPKNRERLQPYVAHFSEAVIAGARRRAEQLNCALEQFWLDEGNMRPDRLNRILRTRGIAGCVISTAASTEPVKLDWDWSPFATALVGHTEFAPQLHRSAHHHYLGMCSALRRLRDEGWQKPAAILGGTIQRRIHNMQTAAFLANHPLSLSAPRLLQLSEPNQLSKLAPWPDGETPDSLILQWQIDAELLRALLKKMPTIKRAVTLDWYPHGALPGIDPTYDVLAERAVDLVVEQLHNNECGIPERPRIMLFEGLWRESPPANR